MNSNYEIDLTFDLEEEIELLRIEALIEKREEYEEEFLSMKSFNSLDLLISNYDKLEKADYEINPINPFEDEDIQMQLRDEKLIEEREIYESYFFSNIESEIVESNLFELQIESYEECDYDIEDEILFEEKFGFDYDEYEEEMYWELHYLRENQFIRQPDCKCPYNDYIPNDDGFCDYLDCYDYPEGPDENLYGVKFC